MVLKREKESAGNEQKIRILKLLPRVVQNNHSCLPALASLFRVVPRECRAQQALLQTHISTRAGTHTARPPRGRVPQRCPAGLAPHPSARAKGSPWLSGHCLLMSLQPQPTAQGVGPSSGESVKTNKTQTPNISQALVIGNLTQVLTVATYSEGVLGFRLQRGSQAFTLLQENTGPHPCLSHLCFRPEKFPTVRNKEVLPLPARFTAFSLSGSYRVRLSSHF